MKRNILNKASFSIKFAAVCGMLFIFSCKAKKAAIITPPVSTNITEKPAPDTKHLKLEAIRAGQSSFNTFSGKARTKLDINGNSNDVTLNIRIKHDKKIWVSVTAIAGIEVARALITPDSILLVNRLQSVYVRKPFSYVNKLAGNQVNYQTVESLLIGNIIPELLKEDADLKSDSASTILTGNLQELVYKLLVSGAALKPSQTNLENRSEGESLQVSNSAFTTIGIRTVPTQIDIASVVKDKKIQVNLHYIKTDFDLPLEFTFSIPSRYTEVN